MNRAEEIALQFLDGSLGLPETDEWRKSQDVDADARRIWVSVARTEAALRRLSPPPDVRAAVMHHVLAGRQFRLPAWLLAAAGLTLCAGLWVLFRDATTLPPRPHREGVAPRSAIVAFGQILSAGTGAFLIEPGDGSPEQPVDRTGQAVPDGSCLRTAPGAAPTVARFGHGQAEITLFEGSEVVLKGGATGSHVGLIADLTTGEVEVHILRKGYACEVRTDVGTARAVGTQFRVRLTEEEKTMKRTMLVTVMSGAVMVGQTMVMAGEQVAVGVSAGVAQASPAVVAKARVMSLRGQVTGVDAAKRTFVVAVPQEVGAAKEVTVFYTKDTKVVRMDNQVETAATAEYITKGVSLSLTYSETEAGKTASKVWLGR